MARYDDQFMRHTDALAWNMEHDPGLRSTIVGVTWLDARPDMDVLTARLDRATRIAPRFRQRPVRPPGLFATPRWVDCDLDLSIHLRRMDAPHPHTARTVIDFARSEAMTEFDPSRPLWTMTLVEGLEGDRAALVLKIHHSLTDGVGAVQLGLLLFETEPEPGPVVPVEDVGPAPTPSGPELTLEALSRAVHSAVSTARGGVERIVPTATTAVRHPVRSTLDVLATASSLGRFVMPVPDTLSPIMRRRGLGRHLDMIEVDLGELKAAGAAVGSTVNDAFVASVSGGLRRYHALHGATVKDLRVTMPISMRRASDPVGGNRITLERFTVPVGEADPGTRVRMTGWLCRAARYEEALPLSDIVAGVLNLLPSGVVGSMLKHVDFLASDVPGIPVRLYLAGAPVTGYYAFGPTTGAALNVTLVSYRGTCCVGCNVDTTAVPDPDVLIDCLRQGFDEVLALAGGHRPASSPLADPERAAGPPPDEEGGPTLRAVP
jgi:diacylglycerol O-acyltransferase / wax synthase